MSRIFTHELRGHSLSYDPLKVRRLLLVATDGRAWQYMHDLIGLKDGLKQLEAAGEDPQYADRRHEVEARTAVANVSIANLEGTLAEAALNAFDLLPVTPGTNPEETVTELEALEVLSAYMEYAEKKE